MGEKVSKTHEPKTVARYGDNYTITQGVVNGMFYVFERTSFVGLNVDFDKAVELIELREGMYYDPEKLKDLR